MKEARDAYRKHLGRHRPLSYQMSFYFEYRPEILHIGRLRQTSGFRVPEKRDLGLPAPDP